MLGWKNIQKILIGNSEMSIPSRFLRITLLLVSLFLFLQLILAAINHQMGSIIVAASGATIFPVLLISLHFSKKERYVKIILFIAACGILSMSWIENAGVLGSTSPFFILTIFAFTAFTPSRYHAWVIGFLLLFYATWLVIEYQYPALIHPYKTPLAHRLDIGNCVLLISFVITTIFSLMVRELERKNKELETQYQAQKVLTETIDSQYQEQIELNTTLDSFIYRSTHDLRAPICSALGLINVARMASSKEEIMRYLTLQEKSLKKLDGFVTDVLFYSHNRQKDIQLQEIDFQDIIATCLGEIESLPQFPKIDFSFNISPDLKVISDKMRMKILFNHLITNAYKYYDATKEAPFLHISIEKKSHFITFIFEDNGIGISQIHLPHIFEMFYRANPKSDGSGIGLYVVQQCMEKIGASITCHSVEGKGTSFFITMPS